MNSYRFLMDLAVILLSTKALGLITRRLHMPQVVGALLAGLILGPGMLGLIHETTYIANTAEIGVVVLMFCAGMETDVCELKKAGKASFIIAFLGVFLPLVSGLLTAAFLNGRYSLESGADVSVFFQNLFIGIILTATSVSITVEALKEIGKLDSAAGNAILGAAIIDDVLGIIAFTIVTGLNDSNTNFMLVIIKVFGFFAFSAIMAVLFHKVLRLAYKITDRPRKRHAISVFVLCLIMSYCAEHFFDVADITGAFIAGLIVSTSPFRGYMEKSFDTLSSLYLSPLFFASIGLSVILPKMDNDLILFTAALTAVAIISKVVGCGYGARMMSYSKQEALQIGIGMISRGEVALIVAHKGQALGLVNSELLGPIVVVVIITTIITPILLKLSFSEKVAG
ncbi:MAG: cation:proton antiporter [Mogibacterium sp.]|nr:cation:proton antiporter [Mogibacterium sp.]